MCYDIKASLEAQLSRASRVGDKKAMEDIWQQLIPFTDLPLHHTTGFQHPNLLIYTDRSPELPEVAVWGLVPHWVKDSAQLKKTWNTTLNARGETIFEKPAFRASAKSNRCIIYVDGFYEHHHFNNKVYPFYIFPKDKKPLALAGLYSEWADRDTGELLNTFSIVTTEGNKMMAKIHNNPKLEGPRMPLILPTELEDKWLAAVNDELDIKQIKLLIQSYPEDELDSHPVAQLRGKSGVGNVVEASDPFNYGDLANSKFNEPIE